MAQICGAFLDFNGAKAAKITTLFDNDEILGTSKIKDQTIGRIHLEARDIQFEHSDVDLILTRVRNRDDDRVCTPASKAAIEHEMLRVWRIDV